jgi:hypothetical protein
VLIAQHVAANATRDAFFLTWFPVTSLPFFVGSSAILAVPAVEAASRLLVRFGSARVVPTVLGLSAVLFLTEWVLLASQPRAVAVLLYGHSTVLTAIAISMFWSLLNERFDPHSAKPLMARVAAAAAFGGLVGGVGAERIAALLPDGALLLALGLLGVVSVQIGAAIALGRGAGPPGLRKRTGRLQRVEQDPARTPCPGFGSRVAPGVAGPWSSTPSRRKPWRTGKRALVRFFGLFSSDRPPHVLPSGHGGALPARSSAVSGRRGRVTWRPLSHGSACSASFSLGPWRGIVPPEG